MTTPMEAKARARTRRKQVAAFGYGDRKVRVFVEADGERVLAMWREHAARRYRGWPNTAVAKLEALAFAETLSRSLGEPAAPAQMSLRQIWDKYVASQFRELRPRTRELCAERWNKWELFIGPHALADTLTLDHVDRFRQEMHRRGRMPNQTRSTIAVVKLVLNWAESRDLVVVNKLARYRFKLGKEEATLEPSEFLTAEWERVLRALGGQTHASWRPWAVTLIAGSLGARVNAILNLRWSDVDLVHGTVTWAARFDKQGRSRLQPLTYDALSALLAARAWRDRLGYAGDWIFFSTHGGSEQRVGGRGFAGVYRYQSWWAAFQKAQDSAGVMPVKYRGAHGLRKMASGNVLEATSDSKVALDWIGDRDPRRMREYLKVRDERMRTVADALDSTHASPRGRSPRLGSKKG